MNSYSKEGQDQFVSKLIQKPGFFLDIGCGTPIENNNTYLLESLGWNGILVDNNTNNVEMCRAQRKSMAVVADASNVDWIRLLERQLLSKTIDYISLDVDDSNGRVIQTFPLREYEFKILTYETDLYNGGVTRQRISEQVLSDFPQYRRIVKNVCLEDGRPFEDWWLNTNYFKIEDHSVWKLEADGISWKEFLDKLK